MKEKHPAPPHPVRDRSPGLQSAFSRLNFECLSDRWSGWKADYNVRCANGHKFQKPLIALLKLKGCTLCRAGARQTRQVDLAQQLQQIAQSHGGSWLNDNLRTALSFYTFTCSAGHFWTARGHEVLQGSWCPYCPASNAEPALARMAKAAQEKGGVLLSESFAGTTHKYRFRCKEGHEWDSRIQNILNGSWCKKCHTNSRKLTLEIAQQHARDHGGECLSTHYAGCLTHLLWSCKEGHQWLSPLTRIRSGHWCAECSRIRRKKSKLPANVAVTQARSDSGKP